MLSAVDTNVPLDLASGVEDVIDALEAVHGRIKGARLIAPPTVNLELAYLSQFAEESDVRAHAQSALVSLRGRWRIEPANLVPVEHGIVDVIAAKLRSVGLIPADEVHDSLILAESALLGCRLLLTSDAHLRGHRLRTSHTALEGFRRCRAHHCDAAGDCPEILPVKPDTSAFQSCGCDCCSCCR